MVDIYWSVSSLYSPEGVRAEEPVSIASKFFEERINKFKEVGDDQINYNKCGAVINELHNLYGVKSIYDYLLEIDKENNISCGDYDKQFFDDNVYTKNKKAGVFEFAINYVFFTDEKSLEMSILPAYLEDSDLVNSTIMIPGRIDIGKYFRTLGYAFHKRSGAKKVRFNLDEVMCYIKFHTKEEINFKRFHFTKDLDYEYKQMMAAKRRKYKIKPLEYYYSIFNKMGMKQRMMKIIKENLIVRGTG